MNWMDFSSLSTLSKYVFFREKKSLRMAKPGQNLLSNSGVNLWDKVQEIAKLEVEQ